MNGPARTWRQGTSIILVFVVLGGLAAWTGCRKKVALPAYTADAAGPQAMAAFDANKDGKLDAKELAKSPGLAAAKASFDKDGNGELTADEISARVKAYSQGGVALMPFSCRVTQDGVPVTNAQVTLTPEAFLGPQIQSATGVTDKNGFVSPTVEEMKAKGFTGVHCGVYRITITRKDADGMESIPAAYNTETMLGVEVAIDGASTEGALQIQLSSSGRKTLPGGKN